MPLKLLKNKHIYSFLFIFLIACNGVTDAVSVINPPIPPDKDVGYYLYSYDEQITETQPAQETTIFINLFTLEGSDATASNHVNQTAASAKFQKARIVDEVLSAYPDKTSSAINFTNMLDSSAMTQVISAESDFTTAAQTICTSVTAKIATESSYPKKITVSGWGGSATVTVTSASEVTSLLKPKILTAINTTTCKYYQFDSTKKYILHADAQMGKYAATAIANEILGPGIRSVLDTQLYDEKCSISGKNAERTSLEWISFGENTQIGENDYILTYDVEGISTGVSNAYEIDAGQFAESTSNKIQTGTETIPNPSSYGPPTITVPIYGIGSKHGVRQASSISSESTSTTFTPIINTAFPYIYYRTSASAGTLSFDSDYFSDANTIYTKINQIATNTKASLPSNCENVSILSSNTLTLTSYILYERPETAIQSYMSGTTSVSITLTYKLLAGKIYFKNTFNTITNDHFKSAKVITVTDLTDLSQINEITSLQTENTNLMKTYTYRTVPLIKNIYLLRKRTSGDFFPEKIELSCTWNGTKSIISKK